jgi:hypothetical protein
MGKFLQGSISPDVMSAAEKEPSLEERLRRPDVEPSSQDLRCQLGRVSREFDCPTPDIPCGPIRPKLTLPPHCI